MPFCGITSPLCHCISKHKKNFLITSTFPSSLPHIHTLPSRWVFYSASSELCFILASFSTLFALGYWVTDVGGKQITNSCCNQHEWRKQPFSCCIQYYSDSDTLWPAFWCMYFWWLIYKLVVNSSSFFCSATECSQVVLSSNQLKEAASPLLSSCMLL